MGNARIFFAGVGTAIVLTGVGLGSGLLFASTAKEPVALPQTTVADRLPPARVILPTSAEPALPRAQIASRAPDVIPQTLAAPQLIPAKDARANAAERDKQAERAEKSKIEAAERERRKRTAERNAQREAARLQQQHDAPKQERPSIMEFGGGEPRAMTAGLFGN